VGELPDAVELGVGTVTPAFLHVSANDESAELWSPVGQTDIKVFCTSDALLQIALRSAGLSCVLMAARRQAGGVARALPAVRRRTAMTDLNCIVMGRGW